MKSTFTHEEKVLGHALLDHACVAQLRGQSAAVDLHIKELADWLDANSPACFSAINETIIAPVRTGDHRRAHKGLRALMDGPHRRATRLRHVLVTAAAILVSVGCAVALALLLGRW